MISTLTLGRRSLISKIALQGSKDDLNRLQNATIQDVEFNKETRCSIVRLFDTIARCNGGRYESTAASKVLHVVNPKLFVMWV